MREITTRTIYCQEGCGKGIHVGSTRMAYAKMHDHEQQCEGDDG